MIFSFISNVFINIHELENKIICISEHQVKVLCISLVFESEMLLRYEHYCIYTHTHYLKPHNGWVAMETMQYLITKMDLF